MKKLVFFIQALSMSFCIAQDLAPPPPAHLALQQASNSQTNSTPAYYIYESPKEEATNKSAHNGFFCGFDFIYWVVSLENIAYAASGKLVEGNVNLANNLRINQSTVYKLPTNLAPGFKASLGYDFENNGWDLLANYTWIYQKTSASKSDNPLVDSSNNLIPTWKRNFIFDTSLSIQGMSEANATWRLHYYAGDLSLGRKIFIENSLCLRPHFGLKAAHLPQNYDLNYRGIITSSVNQSTLRNLSYRINQSYWGLGVRSGIDSSWKFNNHFGLFAKAAVSLLWGEFTVISKEYDDLGIETSSGLTEFTNVEVLNRKIHKKTIKPVFEGTLGLFAQMFFKNETIRLRGELGWEEQFWLDQNQLQIPSWDLKAGDLSMQGLTASLRLDF